MVHFPFTVSPPDITLANRDGKAGLRGASLPACPRSGALRRRRRRACRRGDSSDRPRSRRTRRGRVRGAPRPCRSHDAAEVRRGTIWPEMETNVALDADVGDARATDEAFQSAAHVVRIETKVPRVTGVPMEPRTALAVHEPASGKITLYAGGGGFFGQKGSRRHAWTGAGQDTRGRQGRGRKLRHAQQLLPGICFGCVGARRLGRPVKWTADRTEAFLSDYHGRDLAVSAELALDSTGNSWPCAHQMSAISAPTPSPSSR